MIQIEIEELRGTGQYKRRSISLEFYKYSGRAGSTKQQKKTLSTIRSDHSKYTGSTLYKRQTKLNFQQ